MIKEYIAYVKDNPEGYWFKRKCYGWGWTPATREGYAVLLLFTIFIIWNRYRLLFQVMPTDTQLLLFWSRFIVAVFLLILVCYAKGEKPRWQWGLPRKDVLK